MPQFKSTYKNRIRGNWQGKNTNLDIHSFGWHPKTINDVKITMGVDAEAYPTILPLLERSLQKFKAGKDAELISVYNGGMLAIVTYRDTEGFACQFAATTKDLANLGECDLARRLGKMMADLAPRAKPFVMELTPPATVDAGQHRSEVPS